MLQDSNRWADVGKNLMEETPFECPVLMRDKKQRHTVNGTVGENYFADVHVSSSSKKVTLDIVEQFTGQRIIQYIVWQWSLSLWWITKRPVFNFISIIPFSENNAYESQSSASVSQSSIAVDYHKIRCIIWQIMLQEQGTCTWYTK